MSVLWRLAITFNEQSETLRDLKVHIPFGKVIAFFYISIFLPVYVSNVTQRVLFYKIMHVCVSPAYFGTNINLININQIL